MKINASNILERIFFVFVTRYSWSLASYHHPFFDSLNFNGNEAFVIARKGFIHNKLKLSPYSKFIQNICDHNSKIIVFYSPKVGSTSLFRFVDRYLPHLISGYQLFPHSKRPIPLNLFEAEESKGEIFVYNNTILWDKMKNYEKFIVVRDPYLRLVSFYKNKLLKPIIRRKHKSSRAMIKSVVNLNLKIEDLEMYSFDAFIREYHASVFKNNRELRDIHLAPQVTSDFIDIGLKDVKFITLQQLDDFQDYWAKKNGISNCTKNRFNVFNDESKETVFGASKLGPEKIRTLGYMPSNKDFFDEELLLLVKEIYAGDYKVFNQFDIKFN